MTAGQFVGSVDSVTLDIELSPTARTTLTRGRMRARTERTDLVDVLESARVCHLGVMVDGSVRVLPTAFGVDFDGPDRGGSLYLHGSVVARSLVEAPASDICVTVTVLDGLVLARSAFHHSMNYRSAVVLGRPRVVSDEIERARALDAIVDQVVDGRSRHLRAHTKKELAATVVLALPLYESSVKARSGDPVDDVRDVEAGGSVGRCRSGPGTAGRSDGGRGSGTGNCSARACSDDRAPAGVTCMSGITVARLRTGLLPASIELLATCGNPSVYRPHLRTCVGSSARVTFVESERHGHRPGLHGRGNEVVRGSDGSC